VRKLPIEEKEKLLNDVSSHNAVCMKSKEIKEIVIKKFEDMKKVAKLLESKNWIAIYATYNKDDITIVLSKL